MKIKIKDNNGLIKDIIILDIQETKYLYKILTNIYNKKITNKKI